MSSDVNKFHFRLVLLGSNATGKTAILNRFLFKKFETKYKPTVEDLFAKSFDFGSLEINVDFLDTSGSMQFPAMRRLSITTSDAFLIVYSLDDSNSFEVLKMCMAEIQEVRPNDFHEIPIVFAGNKCDLPKEERIVTKELVSNYVYYELPRLRAKVIECSCKENVNIENIFRAYLSLARVSLPSQVTPSDVDGGKKSRQSNKQATSLNRTQQSSSSLRKRPATVPADATDASSSGTIKSSGSFRVALGVRKSCDASIISSMRKVSLGSQRNSREQLESMHETEFQMCKYKHNNLNGCCSTSNAGNNDIQSQNQSVTDNNVAQVQKSSIENILREHALLQHSGSTGHSSSGNKLHVQQTSSGAKPRSKSLIWRPHRKSSRSSTSDASECRVT